MGWRVQHGLRQDQAIGGNDGAIGMQGSKGGSLGLVGQGQGRADRQAQGFGAPMHRRGGQSPAIGGPRRLGVDGGKGMACGYQRVQCGDGKVGGSHEDKAHGKAVSEREREREGAWPAMNWNN